MNRLRVLWVEDDECISMRAVQALNDVFNVHEPTVQIDNCTSPAQAASWWIESARRKLPYDLLLLDYMFDKIQLPGVEAGWNGLTVLEQFEHMRIRPPFILLSQMLPAEGQLPTADQKRFLDAIKPYRDGLVASLDKTGSWIDRLATAISNFLHRPPLTLVLLSDLHLGRIASTALSFDNLLFDIQQEFARTANELRPDGLCILGDFAWTSQSDDHGRAPAFVQTACNALGISVTNGVHFCPGNHDVLRTGTGNWDSFHQFIQAVHCTPMQISSYSAFNHRTGRLEAVHEPHQLLALSAERGGQLLFVALNSVFVKDGRTHGEIGRTQWQDLQRRMEDIPNPPGCLRIALMHHPLFPVPDDLNNGDERVLADQARALRIFTNLGFQLVLHGHSHHACIYCHEFHVLNQGPGDPHFKKRKVVAVSVPTFGGHPSHDTPYRQYAILRVSHPVKPGGKGSLSLRTRILRAGEMEWADGSSAESIIELD